MPARSRLYFIGLLFSCACNGGGGAIPQDAALHFDGGIDPPTPPCAGHIAFPELPIARLSGTDVALVDLDGDGRVDLITSGENTDLLQVALGHGDGTFGAKASYPTGFNARTFAVRDLNADGKPDIVVANFQSNSVGVFINNGNGTFAAQATYNANLEPSFVALGDLTGDGKPEIVVTNFQSQTISVLINNGSGVFGAPTTYAAGLYASGVAIADVSGDGKNDVVVPNLSDSTVGVYINSGNGTLNAPVAYATPPEPYAIAIADVTGDGKLDLVVVADASGVAVLTNLGTGTFAAHQDYATSPTFHPTVAVGDIDGDGHLDVAVNTRNDAISILLGTASGLSAAIEYSAPRTTAIALADINGDSKLDIASETSTFVQLLRNQGNGTFWQPIPFLVARTSPRAMALEDIDGNGHRDLIATSADLNVLADATATMFAAPQVFPDNGGYWLAVGDLNGDSKPDAVVASPIDGNVVVLINHNGAFDLPLQSYPTGVGPNSVAIGDLDQDGKPDLAVANAQTITILHGQGDGTFTTATSITIDGTAFSVNSVAIGDLNNDGKLDLVVGVQGKGVEVLLNLGGGFGLPTTTYRVGAFPIALADINADGALDVVTDRILLGNGDGTLSTGALPVFPDRFTAIRDLDGDHKLDLVFGDVVVDVAFGNGDGTFSPTQGYVALGAANLVGLTDVDGDARPDIVAVDYDGRATILRTTCVP
jgi:hypothetical protein